MIELKVNKYCQDCPRFFPEVDKSVTDTFAGPVHHTIIYCENRERCQALYDHIWKHYTE